MTLNRGIGPDGDAGNSAFLYEGQSYIFGQLAPIGTIQTDLQVNTAVQSQGYLQVGHVADPLSTGTIQSGAWWKQAYNPVNCQGVPLADVALNHPQRWEQKEPTSQNTQQVRFNCPIGYTSAFGMPTDDPGECTITTTQPTPTNVTDAPFYQMKGLFVTPGTSAGGPTTTLAMLGDTVTLQARVYNYSLADMPTGTGTPVHVRFYAQPWDAAHGQFAAGTGQYGFADAVFINEVQLPPIPAFCGGSQGDDSCTEEEAPLNWVLAQTSWDTSTLNPQPTTETTW